TSPSTSTSCSCGGRRMRSRSPGARLRAGFARTPFTATRPAFTASLASARVLKKRAHHSHLSRRWSSMPGDCKMAAACRTTEPRRASMTAEREFLPLQIAVLTVSDSRTEADDRSGRLLVERLEAAGHRLFDRQIVRDDIYRIRAVVSAWIA